jgi:hypothetical protein
MSAEPSEESPACDPIASELGQALAEYHNSSGG